MDKILSARVEESVEQRIGLLARRRKEPAARTVERARKAFRDSMQRREA